MLRFEGQVCLWQGLSPSSWVFNELYNGVTLMIITFAPKVSKISCKHQPRRKLSTSWQVASEQGRTVLWLGRPSPPKCHGRKSQLGGGRTSLLRYYGSRLTGIVAKSRGRFEWWELQIKRWINRLHQPFFKGSVFISQEFTTMQPRIELVTVDCPQTIKILFFKCGEVVTIMGQPGIEFS